VHIVRNTEQDVFVEWLRVGTAGETTTLAKFALPPERATRFEVVTAPDQFIRFSTAGSRPLTVRAADLLATDVWHVQPFDAASQLALWGSAGHVPRLPVGAVLITAEAAACATALTFRLGIIATTHRDITRPILITEDVARCRWIFIGLTPGSFQASLRAAHGVSGRREFRVVAGESTEISIPPPLVTVSGVVSLNEERVSEGRLEFLNSRSSVVASVEADGSYNLGLDEDGPYSVTLRLRNRSLKPIETSLVPGANSFDVDIDDAQADTRLTLRVIGLDQKVQTEIEIRSQANVVLSTIPAGADTYERRGLPFGTHRVSARQPGASSDWQEFDLSAAQPVATADVALTRATRSITLRYVDGEPVTNAGFQNTSARPEEIVPGTYSLASVAPNTELVIRPPSGPPLCKIVPAAGDVEAIAPPGRSVTLRFATAPVSIEEVKIASEGWDCPVRLGAFLKTPFRSGQVEVLNAPPDDVIIIHLRDGVHRVVVQPDGVALVPAKQ
jgi:hypothetical protein